MLYVLFLVISFVISVNSTELSVGEEWEAFKTMFSKQYKDNNEESFRLLVFLGNKYLIAKHNKMASNGSKGFTLAMNQFGDLTHQEFVSLMNGFKKSNKNHSIDSHLSSINESIPDSIDWRTKGYVTGVKDQGQCGSCWAFSATGSLEGQHFRKFGELFSLSEQNLVDCSQNYGNNRCNGGYMDAAFQYIKDNNGIDTEQSYPYKGEDQTCRFNPDNIGATVSGFVDIPYGNEDKLKEAVGTLGPVSVVIDARGLQFYSKGVYDDVECSPNNLDHAVLVVGYGTDPSGGGDFWIIKNSWGTSWGDNGYVNMLRNGNNYCGIASMASYPLTEKLRQSTEKDDITKLKKELDIKFEKAAQMQKALELRFEKFLKVYEIEANPTSCGKWQNYNDEKCFEILDKDKFLTFEDSIKLCSQFENSSELLTIQSKEELIFISNYLFKLQKLENNIWLGLRKISGSFEWINSSNKRYFNWKKQNPVDKTDYNCVQMDSESEWSNEPCSRKSLVVCQMIPKINLSDLTKKIIHIEEEIKITKEELKITNIELKKELELNRKQFNLLTTVIFNKKVILSQLFTDTDGKNKAFLMPLSSMKQIYQFDESVTICESLNSSLVEIESKEKQLILESFLVRIALNSQLRSYFWINVKKSNSGNFFWIKSNRVLSFTNWAPDWPISNSGYDNVLVYSGTGDKFGKWINNPKGSTWKTLCEYTFNS